MEGKSSKLDLKKKRNRKRRLRLYNRKWVILITIWTFFLATSMSFISETILRNVNILIAFIILIIIIFIGIFFDLVGIAVASAQEKPFHAMASNKIKGAVFAVKLVKNAGPVANFCNDVIGDICGIVSGAAGAIIILHMNQITKVNISLLSIVLSGVVAATTVGGKAAAKGIALKNSKEIVYYVGKTLYYIHEKTGLDVFPKKTKRETPKRNGK